MGVSKRPLVSHTRRGPSQNLDELALTTRGRAAEVGRTVVANVYRSGPLEPEYVRGRRGTYFTY